MMRSSRDEQELRRIVREVPLDPGLSALVQSLRTAGAEIVVLSDGYGFYAEEVCEGQDFPLISNHIDWQAWSVKFPAISAAASVQDAGPASRPPSGRRRATAVNHRTR